MLKTDLTKTAALFMAHVMLFTAAVPGCAADEGAAVSNNELYFEALNDEVVENVQTTTVKRGDFIVNAACRARIEYENITYVFNTIAEGDVEVTNILVSSGDEVKRGDPIAELKVSISKETVEELEARIEADEESLDNFIATNTELLRHYEELAKSSASAADRRVAGLLYDRLSVSYTEELNSRQDSLEAEKATLATYKSLIETQYIKAPASGRVANIVRRGWGDTIGYYGYICSIYDTEHIRLRVTSGGQDLRYNQVVYAVQSGNNGELAKGRVTTCLSPALSSNLVGTVNYVEIGGDHSKFKLEEEVTLRYESQHMNNVILVSKKAVRSDSGGMFVYLYENGSQYKRYIVTGGNNTDFYWVVKGLEEGDVVTIH